MKYEKQKYILEKNILTHDDFEIMGWYDARIYGFIIEKLEDEFSRNLLFDIDTDECIADILEIADLCLVKKNEIEANRFEYQWGIEFQQGHISLKSYRMQQIVRKHPIFTKGQTLDIDVRESVSFGKTPINI